MTALTDIPDSGPWKGTPTRNCEPPADATPKERGAHTDLWHPSEIGEEKFAKRLCDGCVSKLACLEWALAAEDPQYGYPTGVYGGTTTRQRQDIRSKRRRAVA